MRGERAERDAPDVWEESEADDPRDPRIAALIADKETPPDEGDTLDRLAGDLMDADDAIDGD